MFNVQILPTRQATVATALPLTAAPVESLMNALVDAIDCGVIVSNAHGTVCFANQAARQQADLAGAYPSAARAMHCGAHDAAALDAAIRSAATKGRRQLLVLGSGEGRLMVSVLPLALPEACDPRVLLLLGRRGSCSTLALEMLANVHGLTLAERRVLAGLLAESTPREVAAALGVALSTVRTQILSIRAKLGVRSIEALLLRAAEVPPMAAVVRQASEGPWQGALRHGTAAHARAA